VIFRVVALNKFNILKFEPRVTFIMRFSEIAVPEGPKLFPQMTYKGKRSID
jgi:hypothetical protein